MPVDPKRICNDHPGICSANTHGRVLHAAPFFQSQARACIGAMGELAGFPAIFPAPPCPLAWIFFSSCSMNLGQAGTGPKGRPRGKQRKVLKTRCSEIRQAKSVRRSEGFGKLATCTLHSAMAKANKFVFHPRPTMDHNGSHTRLSDPTFQKRYLYGSFGASRSTSWQVNKIWLA